MWKRKELTIVYLTGKSVYIPRACAQDSIKKIALKREELNRGQPVSTLRDVARKDL
jgi:hypothetical protein